MGTDELYQAHDQRRSRPANIDRTKLHPHPHGDPAREAERAAMQAAIVAKKAESKKAPPQTIPQRPHEKEKIQDNEGRRPEARDNFITMSTWHNGVVVYVEVKTKN